MCVGNTFFRNEPESDETTYIPGMHINSENEPDEEASDEEASKGIEICLNNFKAELTKARKKYFRKKIPPNLTPLQCGIIHRITSDSRYKVLASDKNCGTAIMDTEYYTKNSVAEHLSDKTVYKRLTKGEARSYLTGVARLLEAFVSRH